MIPILYDKLKTTFTNDYIGFLMDAVSCTVLECRNEEYELEMEYPIDGIHYERLEQDAIILAKPNNHDDPQPFRIYKIIKQSDMIITVYARHIVYDLSKVTVEPFQSSGTIEDAIDGMIEHSIPSCGFIFETDKTTAGNYKVGMPTSFRALMGGIEGSLLDVYGTGEYHYDGYNIELLLNRGSNNGAVIRYGKDLTDIKQEEECDKVYTAVFPYYLSGTEYLQLDEKIISVPGQFPFSRIMSLDLSMEFENTPTQLQLKTKAEEYIAENNIGVPSVDLDVDFSTVGEQDISLCDIVTVEFEQYGISATAKCIELTYDVLRDRVDRVRLGYYKNNFVDTVVDQMKGITEYITLRPTDIEAIIKDISKNENGYVLLHSSTNQAKVDEILLLTGTDNLATVQKLWRWNKNGLGYSSTGYNGTYGTAITMLGQIVASMITTGTLRAIEIKAGSGNTYPFQVTPNGVLTAKSGYIGSTSTGFHITGNPDRISNTKVFLFSYGIGFFLNNTDIGYLGRIDGTYHHTSVIIPSTEGEITVNDGDEFSWWSAPDGTLLRPGIGINANQNAGAIAFAQYSESQQTNLSFFRFTVRDTGVSGVHVGAIDTYKNIEMHGHGFFGRFVDPNATTYNYPYGIATNYLTFEEIITSLGIQQKLTVGLVYWKWNKYKLLFSTSGTYTIYDGQTLEPY